MDYLVVIKAEYYEGSGGTYKSLDEAMNIARMFETISDMMGTISHCDVPHFQCYVTRDNVDYFTDGSGGICSRD